MLDALAQIGDFGDSYEVLHACWVPQHGMSGGEEALSEDILTCCCHLPAA